MNIRAKHFFASFFTHWGAAGAVLLVVFAVCIHAIHSTYMHADEELSYRTTTGHSLAYVIEYEARNDVHPPLWYALFWGWQNVAGDSEFAGRLHAILLSLLTLALAYRFAQDWIGIPYSGLFSISALAVNAYFFIYTLDIRPYALVMLLVSFSMWAFMRWLKKPAPGRAFLYGLSLALLLYTHYYTVFILPVQGLWWLLQRPSRKSVIQGAGAALLGFLLWLPWLPVFVGQINTIKSLTEETSAFGVGAPTETTRNALDTLPRTMTNGLPLLYAGIVSAGILLLRPRRAYFLSLLWAIIPAALLLTLNLFAAIYTQRYIVYIVVGFGIAVGCALAALPGKMRWLGLLGFIGLNLWLLPAQLPQRPPYRQMLLEVAAAAQDDDVLFFNQAYETEGLIHWQYRHYLPESLLKNRVSHADDALQARRVWYITAAWGDPQINETFLQLSQTHPLQKVVGDCNAYWCYLFQLLEAPPAKEAVLFGDHLEFWG